MVTIESVQNGIARYIDEDLLPRLPVLQRVGLGMYSGAALKNLGELLNVWKDSPYVQITHWIAQDGSIDIDAISKELFKRMEKDPKIPINIPFINKCYTLDKSDISRIIEYIKG